MHNFNINLAIGLFALLLPLLCISIGSYVINKRATGGFESTSFRMTKTGSPKNTLQSTTKAFFLIVCYCIYAVFIAFLTFTSLI